MRKHRLTALILCAAMAIVPASSCQKNKKKSSSSQIKQSGMANIGVNEINVGLSEEANENDTVFKLNSVIDAGKQTDKGEHYIYLDVTIKNNTDTAYTLNTLNNFYLIMPDSSEVFSAVRTQLYAINNFKEEVYSSDPFEIPANGEFSGYIGGFVLEEGKKEFTVCFFPTKENQNDKEDVIKVKITPDMVADISADVLK